MLFPSTFWFFFYKWSCTLLQTPYYSVGLAEVENISHIIKKVLDVVKINLTVLVYQKDLIL